MNAADELEINHRRCLSAAPLRYPREDLAAQPREDFPRAVTEVLASARVGLLRIVHLLDLFRTLLSPPAPSAAVVRQTRTHQARSGVISHVMPRFAAIVVLLALAAPAFSGPIDFDRDIRPIFSERCYECHGTDKAKGGLRLNDPKIAM